MALVDTLQAGGDAVRLGRVAVIMGQVFADGSLDLGQGAAHLGSPSVAQRGVNEPFCARTTNLERSGSGGRTRTYDQAVNSRPLYH